MNDTQLEAMVVRLYGDGSSYQQMMGQAVSSSQSAMQQTQQYTQQVEGFGQALTGFASTAMLALGALGAAGFLRKAFGQFAEHETTLIRLSSTIRGNGGAVEAVLPAYEAWAKAQKESAGISTDTSLNLLRTAESYRLSGEAAQRASQDAIALSFATRGNADAAEHMIRLTAAMAQGNVHMAQQMGRIVPQLRQFHNDAAGFTAAYQRLITTGVATSVDVMNSAEGVVKRYNAAWSALTKQFGRFVVEAAVPVIKWLTESITAFTKLDESTRRFIVVGALLAAGILAIGPALGTIMVIAGPVIAVFTSGFGLIVSTIGLVLSPLLIVKTAIIAVGVVAGAVFSPIGIAVVAVSLAILGLIRRAGGLSTVWESIKAGGTVAWTWIKDKAIAAWDFIQSRSMAFYEWLKPIADAAGAFAVTSWELIKTAAVATWNFISTAAGVVWDYILKVWNGITDGASIDWARVQDIVQRAILFCEFTLLNFKRVASLVWSGIKLDAAIAMDAVANSFVRVTAAGGGAALGVASAFMNMWEVLNGNLEFEDLGQAIANDIRDGYNTIAESMGLGESSITARLRREYAAQQGVLEQSFEEFVEMRRREFARISPAAALQASVPPSSALAANMAAAAKDAHKFDAALSDSREAMYRIASYTALLATPRTGLPSSGGSSSAGLPIGAAPAALQPTNAYSPSTPTTTQPVGTGRVEVSNFARIEELLAQIIIAARGTTTAVQNIPAIVVQGADL